MIKTPNQEEPGWEFFESYNSQRIKELSYKTEKAVNLRTEEKAELKQASREWVECFNNKFLGGWLQDGSLQLQDVCGEQIEKLNEVDKRVYSDFKFAAQ